jgi:hypothetical protein
MRAAMSYLPFGAGTGSFVSVFPQFEAQQDLLRTFANRAHNDFAEAALESGVFAVALIVVFAVWFVRKGIQVWRNTHDVSASYLTLTRAAWIMVGLLALHSFVDYPLRTTALASLAAFSCALLLPPRHHHSRHHHEHGEDDAHHEGAAVIPGAAAQHGRWPSATAHKSSSRPGQGTVADPVTPAEPKAPPRPHQKWDAAVEWPEEWRKNPREASDSKPVPGWDVPRPGPGKKDGDA